MDYSKERKIILELCKFKGYSFDKLNDLLSGDIDEPYLLGQLLFHRLGGIAYCVFKEANLLSKLNRETRSSLEIVFQGYAFKTESFYKALEYLSDIIGIVNFPFALLKGALLAYLYPLGYRTSNDIDILILDEDIDKISEILESNEFKQGKIINKEFVPAKRSEIIFSRMNRGETVPYIKEINLPWMRHLEIDINFSLDYKARRTNDNNRSVMQNILSKIRVLSGNLYTLSNDDFIIHLCTHLYKEASTYPWVKMQRDISLYKYCDIYNLLFLEEFRSDTLAMRISELCANEECYYTFYYTKKLFSLQSDYLDNLLKKIKPCNLEFMNRIVVPGGGYKYYNVDYCEWVFTSNRYKYLRDVISNA